MMFSILKKTGLAILMVAIVVLLTNVLRPDNATGIGSGFTRYFPAVTYPIRMALFSGAIFLIGAFVLKPKVWKTGWFVLLAINLAYLYYCLQTYVDQ